MKKRALLKTAAAVACLGLSGQPFAQPDKPVRIIVGFPPGQATEVIARILAEHLERELKQPVIVENKPGQGGSLALGALASAVADGSVITVSALAAFAINPSLYASVPYDSLKDFAPIGLVADIPTVLVTGVNSGYPTFAALLAAARSRPGALKHSSSGNGTVSHLGMQELKKRAGIDMIHVPYQGSSRAMADVVAGHVDVGLDSVAATRSLVEGKRLVVLAAASGSRLEAFPDVPTLSELGFPGLEVTAWTAVAAPAAIPREARQRLSQAVARIVASPEFSARLAPLGAVARPGSADEFSALLRSELVRWKAAVSSSGAKVE